MTDITEQRQKAILDIIQTDNSYLLSLIISENKQIGKIKMDNTNTHNIITYCCLHNKHNVLKCILDDPELIGQFDINSIHNKDNDTLLNISVYFNSFECYELLLTHPNAINKIDVFLRNVKEKNAIHYLYNGKNALSSNTMDKYMTIYNTFLENKILQLKETQGETPQIPKSENLKQHIITDEIVNKEAISKIKKNIEDEIVDKIINNKETMNEIIKNIKTDIEDIIMDDMEQRIQDKFCIANMQDNIEETVIDKLIKDINKLSIMHSIRDEIKEDIEEKKYNKEEILQELRDEMDTMRSDMLDELKCDLTF